MKSMDLHDDKNSKESLKVSETIEAISNATNSNERANIQPGLQSKSTSRSQTSACALPADIPTLESLSKTSPKLSTWRQTRIISEKLEQHLWTWRCACKKSGKRISKSLLQARAKWAFRKAGIAEFKASDGWYWKWLSKWRRKGQEIGITEQGKLSSMEIQLLPQNSPMIKTEVKEECCSDSCVGCRTCLEPAHNPISGCARIKLEPPSCETATSRCGTSPSSPTTGRASKV